MGQSIFNKRQSDKAAPDDQPNNRNTDDIDFTSQNQDQKPPGQDEKTLPKEEGTKIIKEENVSTDKAEEAKQEALKEHYKEDLQNGKKLDDLVTAANKVLFRCSTIVPLNPFPTDITVSLDKVAIVDRQFIMTAEIHTFPISDIDDVLVRTGIIWSTLELYIESFQEGPIEINYLKTEEAIRVRRLIQGLKICKDEGLNLTEMTEEEISQKVEEIGRAREP